MLAGAAVLQELNAGDYPRKDETIQFVSTIALLPLTEDLEPIVEFYVDNYVMPKSAKMAGLSLEAFIELLGEVGIPAVDYPPDELEKEMTAAL